MRRERGEWTQRTIRSCLAEWDWNHGSFGLARLEFALKAVADPSESRESQQPKPKMIPMKMKAIKALSGLTALLVAGCATTDQTSSSASSKSASAPTQHERQDVEVKTELKKSPISTESKITAFSRSTEGAVVLDSFVVENERTPQQVRTRVKESKRYTELENILNESADAEVRNIIRDRLAQFKRLTLEVPYLYSWEKLGLETPLNASDLARLSTADGPLRFHGFVTNSLVSSWGSMAHFVAEGTVPPNTNVKLTPVRLTAGASKASGSCHLSSIDSHRIFVWNYNVLIPVGSAIRITSDRFVTFCRVECKGGEVLVKETGLEFQPGTEIVWVGRIT